MNGLPLGFARCARLFKHRLAAPTRIWGTDFHRFSVGGARCARTAWFPGCAWVYLGATALQCTSRGGHVVPRLCLGLSRDDHLSMHEPQGPLWFPGCAGVFLGAARFAHFFKHRGASPSRIWGTDFHRFSVGDGRCARATRFPGCAWVFLGAARYARFLNTERLRLHGFGAQRTRASGQAAWFPGCAWVYLGATAFQPTNQVLSVA